MIKKNWPLLGLAFFVAGNWFLDLYRHGAVAEKQQITATRLDLQEQLIDEQANSFRWMAATNMVLLRESTSGMPTPAVAWPPISGPPTPQPQLPPGNQLPPSFVEPMHRIPNAPLLPLPELEDEASETIYIEIDEAGKAHLVEPEDAPSAEPVNNGDAF